MKPVGASFVAMVAAWATPLAVMALWQLGRRGETEDLGVMAGWVGGFTFIAWVVIVAPLSRLFAVLPFFGDLRMSWLGWALLGMACYALLVVPLFSREMLAILWYPAAMGAVAGVAFAWLIRRGMPAGRFSRRNESRNL